MKDCEVAAHASTANESARTVAEHVSTVHELGRGQTRAGAEVTAVLRVTPAGCSALYEARICLRVDSVHVALVEPSLRYHVMVFHTLLLRLNIDYRSTDFTAN